MNKFIITVVVFLACISASSAVAEIPPVVLNEFCGSRRSCYGSPKGCTVEDCTFLISFHTTGMDFLVRDTDFGKYIIFFSEANGTRGDYILLCFPGTAKCFLSVEKMEVTFKTMKKVGVQLVEMDEDEGNYMYFTNMSILTTKLDSTFFVKKGAVSNGITTKGGMQLHHMSKLKAAEVLETGETQFNKESLEDIYKKDDKNSPLGLINRLEKQNARKATADAIKKYNETEVLSSEDFIKSSRSTLRA